MTLSCAILLLALVPIRVAPGLEPADEVSRLSTDAWSALELAFTKTTGHSPRAPRSGVSVERARLAPGTAGSSVVGVISLRQSTAGTLNADERVALKHEVAHQFLLLTCAPSANDRLFHEAFALATSGELTGWNQGDYQSLSEAAKTLNASTSIDAPKARKALARLLAETMQSSSELPGVLRGPLSACDGKVAWPMLTIETLALLKNAAAGAATVVLSRHSGEVIWSNGDIQTARPFGSTLKPFLFAGAAKTPMLSPRAKDPEWACGETLPASMTASQAVLRSCNGYFLDWAEATPGVERFGAWGPVLQRVGLARLPADMSEAIGLRTTLALSPLGLAAAYRLLAEARPDVLEGMKRNASEGTLSGLPESAAVLSGGLATKTGTVRDGLTRATLGWLVAVTPDLVIVHAEPERAPRQFVGAFLETVARLRSMPGRDAVEVQVLGLLQTSQVSLRCPDGGFSIIDGVPSQLTASATPVADLMKRGRLLCLSAPFLAKLKDVAGERPYAGIFRSEVPAPYVPAVGQTVTERERRARTGSEVMFRTTRLSYVAGVLAAEDAAIVGEARAALARVISHNVQTRERHGSRPLCDSTHCQVFKGSGIPRAGDSESLGRPDIGVTGFLSFSRGGNELWEQSRSLKDVQRLLGFSWSSVTGFKRREGSMLTVNRTVIEEGSPTEVTDEVPCERLRGPLKLPSCPEFATTLADGTITFMGTGSGHGLGLDVEAAKRSGKPQDEILRDAYGH